MSQNSLAIRSVIVPLAQELMLLPGSIVAEVVAYATPAPPPAGAPAWMVGTMAWREQLVPLVSVEAFASGGPAPQGSERGRIAVLKVLANASGLVYYGIVTRQIPRLAAVRREALEAVADEDDPRPGIGKSVVLDGERMFIPDLDALEAAVRRAWGE
jgi:chemosensory pili system protein ChpC